MHSITHLMSHFGTQLYTFSTTYRMLRVIAYI